jgi:alkylation response protein AidB-like acyl-CoA dehydrogenase
MDFNLSGQDQSIADAVRSFRDSRGYAGLSPIRDPKDPRVSENMRELGRLGLLGVCLPKEFGGQDLPGLSGVLIIEQLAQFCPRTATSALMSIGGPGLFVAKWGTADQKERYLPALMRGESSFCISLTEPNAGTALTDLETSARKVGDKVILNGRKTLCTGVDDTNHILTFCRFGPGVDDIGAVIVDSNAAGLTLSEPREHMCGAQWFELTFDDVEVLERDVLFFGNAFKLLMASYSLERASSGAWVVGVAQAALDLALQYSLDRKQFGRPICEFEMVQGHLADMYLKLEQARLLLYKSTFVKNGVADQLESSSAKIAATEAACYVTDRAIQIFGGIGASRQLPLEWLYRLVRPFTIAGGTSDIHRSMIAGSLLGRRFNHRA